MRWPWKTIEREPQVSVADIEVRVEGSTVVADYPYPSGAHPLRAQVGRCPEGGVGVSWASIGPSWPGEAELLARVIEKACQLARLQSGRQGALVARGSDDAWICRGGVVLCQLGPGRELSGRVDITEHEGGARINWAAEAPMEPASALAFARRLRRAARVARGEERIEIELVRPDGGLRVLEGAIA